MLTLQDIKDRGEQVIRDAIGREQEGLQLDFKESAEDRGRGKSEPLFSSDDRLTSNGKETIAKALSAFANSAGGMIVIGCVCRKGDDGIDVLLDVAPLPGFRRKADLLAMASQDLTFPTIDHVEVYGFPTDQNPDVGYIALAVERSERRPHRSQAEKRYFRRSGHQSLVMEHYELEDMFNRPTVPILRLSAAPVILGGSTRGGGVSSVTIGATFPIDIHNEGHRSARHISVHLRQTAGSNTSIHHSAPFVIEALRDNARVVRSAELVLNFGEPRRLGAQSHSFLVDAARNEIYLDQSTPMGNIQGLSFDYDIFAEDMRPASGSISWTGDDIRSLEDDLRKHAIQAGLSLYQRR